MVGLAACNGTPATPAEPEVSAQPTNLELIRDVVRVGKANVLACHTA